MASLKLLTLISTIKRFVALMVLTEAVHTALLYFINISYGRLYDFLPKLDAPGITSSLLEISLLALGLVALNVVSVYTNNLAVNKLRWHLDDQFFAYVPRSELLTAPQILQEDCLTYARFFIDILKAVIRSLFLLPTFAYIVVSQAGAMTSMKLLGIVCALTVALPFVAKSLVKKQSALETSEARYRDFLTRNLTRDEWLELGRHTYKKAINDTFKEFNSVFKVMSGTQSLFLQILALVPFILLVPGLLADQYSFGIFKQLTNALDRVGDALSVFIDQRGSLVALKTASIRLSSLSSSNKDN